MPNFTRNSSDLKELGQVGITEQNQYQIYNIPMKFVNKLIHGGPVQFFIDLFHTVNQWRRYTGLSNKSSCHVSCMRNVLSMLRNVPCVLRNAQGVLCNVPSVLRNIPDVLHTIMYESFWTLIRVSPVRVPAKMFFFWPRDLDLSPMTLIFRVDLDLTLIHPCVKFHDSRTIGSTFIGLKP